MQCLLATISLQSIRDSIAGWDAAMFRFINIGLAARWLDFVMLGVTTLGEGWLQTAIGLVVIGAGFGKRRADLRRMGYAALLAYAASGLLSSIVKDLGDRPRPVLVLFDARTVGRPLFINSFPSGHATTAFAAAFVWGAFFPRFRWLLYTLAALVALSRVYLGVHFPFDVAYGAILGALIGVASARMFPTRPVEACTGTSQPEPVSEEAG